MQFRGDCASEVIKVFAGPGKQDMLDDVKQKKIQVTFSQAGEAEDGS